MRKPEIITRPSTQLLVQHVAEWLTEKALAKQDTFALCLAGGSTPKALYTLLAQSPFAAKFPWERTHIFFGDERYVPHTSPDSNYLMASQALLNHISIPPAQIHAVPISSTPQQSAEDYAQTLQTFYGGNALDPEKPLFDVTLLGLGEDGHTASLFPSTEALNERNAWATAVIGAKPEPRITLTYPALENSETVAFIVTGASKHAVTQRVLQDNDTSLPATNLTPNHNYIWFIAE